MIHCVAASKAVRGHHHVQHTIRPSCQIMSHVGQCGGRPKTEATSRFTHTVAASIQDGLDFEFIVGREHSKAQGATHNVQGKRGLETALFSWLQRIGSVGTRPTAVGFIDLDGAKVNLHDS
jgi:hypothetical protein